MPQFLGLQRQQARDDRGRPGQVGVVVACVVPHEFQCGLERFERHEPCVKSGKPVRGLAQLVRGRVSIVQRVAGNDRCGGRAGRLDEGFVDEVQEEGAGFLAGFDRAENDALALQRRMRERTLVETSVDDGEKP